MRPLVRLDVFEASGRVPDRERNDDLLTNGWGTETANGRIDVDGGRWDDAIAEPHSGDRATELLAES